MRYEDWYKEGIKKDHLKYYTLKTMRGLLDNVEVLKQAFTQSVKDKLGKDLTDKIDLWSYKKLDEVNRISPIINEKIKKNGII